MYVQDHLIMVVAYLGMAEQTRNRPRRAGFLDHGRYPAAYAEDRPWSWARCRWVGHIPMIMDGLTTVAGCGGLAAAGAVGGV